MAGTAQQLEDIGRVRLIRLLALAGVTSAIAATALTISFIGFEAWISAFDWFVAVLAIFFGGIAFVASPKEPRNPLMWLMASTALLGGLTILGWPLAGLLGAETADLVGDTIPAELPRASAWVLAFTGWLWAPAMLAPFTFGLLLFPHGKLPTPRWKWTGVLAGVGIGITASGSAWTYRPWSTDVTESAVLIISFGFALVIGAACLSIVALFRGLRTSTGVERQQFKWVTWGTSILVPVFMGLGFVIGGTEAESLLIIPLMVAELIFLVSYGMAIGRYQLFEIDRIVSRSVTYALVIGFLAVVYLGLVAAMTAILPSQSSLAVAMGTLAIAALFNPLRRRAQSSVERRFHRSKYDAQRVIDDFTRSLQEMVEAEQVAASWAQVVSDTMEPGMIGVWLRPD